MTITTKATADERYNKAMDRVRDAMGDDFMSELDQLVAERLEAFKGIQLTPGMLGDLIEWCLMLRVEEEKVGFGLEESGLCERLYERGFRETATPPRWAFVEAEKRLRLVPS